MECLSILARLSVMVGTYVLAVARPKFQARPGMEEDDDDEDPLYLICCYCT